MNSNKYKRIYLLALQMQLKTNFKARKHLHV